MAIEPVTPEQALVNIHYATAQAEQAHETALNQQAIWTEQVARAQGHLDAMKKFRENLLVKHPELAETPLAKHFS